mmetsp:Transcript_103121/g.258558  ORF Transcript_103121/g.258558 Transcript_103121/m.258558 type:complete len:210 (+) Transcript_103121:514-1143(+)
MNFSEIGDKAWYTAYTSSGVEYNFSLDTPLLSTPSSTPPVIPISISKINFRGAMRLKYCAQIAMFSSSGSSLKSSMCDVKSGSPCSAKNCSSTFSMPSNQGSSFLAQWSEWRITGTPYAGATCRTYRAPATAPRIDAWHLSFARALPAKKAEPPCENWIVTGLLRFLPASRAALMLLVVVQLKAGMANPSFFANAYSAQAASPVTTHAS